MDADLLAFYQSEFSLDPEIAEVYLEETRVEDGQAYASFDLPRRYTWPSGREGYHCLEEKESYRQRLRRRLGDQEK